jgi:membrane associated rhomboid family serine protease
VRARRIPWLTGAVFVVTAAVNLWAAADAWVMRALERDPTGLHAGTWWRLASPLLIQSDGAVQLVFNLVTLAGFGVLVEWHLGRWRWLVLYLGAGLLGQALGYAWEPPGGGNSVAVCGLVGGVAAAALLGRPAMPAPAALFAAFYAGALAGLEFGGWIGEMVAIAFVAAATGVLQRALPTGPLLPRIFGGFTVIAALALITVRNHHGASLLFGVAAGLLLAGRVPPSTNSVRGTPRGTTATGSTLG